MTARFVQWLRRKWLGQDPSLFHSYQHAFSSADGAAVLQHLLDSVYCTVYEGTDPQAALAHNARRTVVHEILTNIDLAENPLKYKVQIIEEDIRNGVV